MSADNKKSPEWSELRQKAEAAARQGGPETIAEFAAVSPAEMQRMVVYMKDELEKIKEQVLNVL